MSLYRKFGQNQKSLFFLKKKKQNKNGKYKSLPHESYAHMFAKFDWNIRELVNFHIQM